MNYREIRPARALTRYVKCFWTLEHDAQAAPENILPDGCMEVVINIGEPFRRIYQSGEAERQLRSFIVGEMARYTRIEPSRKAAVFGIRFRPGGAYPFFWCPQDELAGQMISLDLLWGRQIEESILDAGRAEDRVAAAEAGLLRFLRRDAALDRVVEPATSRIYSSGGQEPIDRMARELGMSTRHLERTFRRVVGLSPKSFSRIVRLQRAVKLMERRDRSGALMALECGYYDQAHFIREFKDFAGETPSAYLSRRHPLTESFLGGSDFYNTTDARGSILAL